jgi:hypothetical protein
MISGKMRGTAGADCLSGKNNSKRKKIKKKI